MRKSKLIKMLSMGLVCVGSLTAIPLISTSCSSDDSDDSDSVCPNDWLQVDGSGLLSLRAGVDKTKIHKVIIPTQLSGNDVTGIKYQAFKDCTSLTSITLPNSISTIELYTFEHCPKLASITYTTSGTIGDDSYVLVDGDGNVKVDTNTTTIISNGFLTKYKCVKTGASAELTVVGCLAIGNIKLPSTMASIGGYAFEYCSNINSITYTTPATVNDDSYVLVDGDGNPITTPSTTTTITNGFLTPYRCVKLGATDPLIIVGCLAVGKVKLPSTVTIIGGYAFECCYALKSIIVPQTIISIGEGAFCGCLALASITYTTPATVNDDSYVLVDGDGNPITTPSTTTTITNGFLTPYRCVKLGATDPLEIGCLAIGKIKLPSTVTSIDEATFSGCFAITSVVLATSINYIGGFAFSECPSITSITYTTPATVNDDSYVLVDGDGNPITTPSTTTTITNGFLTEYKCVMSGATDDLISIGSLAVGNIQFPSTVSTISGEAFAENFAITSITLKNSITTIVQSAFATCEALTSIVAYYTSEPNLDGDNVFSWGAPIGTVKNINGGAYTSQDLLTLLKNHGLPNDWVAI